MKKSYSIMFLFCMITLFHSTGYGMQFASKIPKPTSLMKKKLQQLLTQRIPMRLHYTKNKSILDAKTKVVKNIFDRIDHSSCLALMTGPACSIAGATGGAGAMSVIGGAVTGINFLVAPDVDQGDMFYDLVKGGAIVGGYFWGLLGALAAGPVSLTTYATLVGGSAARFAYLQKQKNEKK